LGLTAAGFPQHRLNLSPERQGYGSLRPTLAQASADIPVGAASPRLISAPQPVQTKAPQPALVSVSFEIDERGIPTNIQIDKSSDKDLDDEVIAMIREWRFEAALNGGEGVPSRGYLDLSIGDAPPPLPDGQRRPRHRQ
jgi:TonB family protein